MLFNEEEIIIIQSAIETYNEEPRMLLTPEAQKRHCESTLKKLDNYSVLTNFTKIDYSVMYMSLFFVIETSHSLNETLDDIIYLLFERIGKLAEPEEE